MVRASTSGMIDFSRFDLWDTWEWRRLRWTLDELELKHSREISITQHTHWITLAAKSNLTNDSFELCKRNAAGALNKLLQATYPWLSEQILADSDKTDRDDAVESYYREFGRPGEPQYEAMIDTISTALKRGKMSPRDKAKDRARRRALREQAEAA